MSTTKRRRSAPKRRAPISNKATSWSFSRYSDYKQCPLKFKLKHIDKIKEPGSPAMQRGADIHDMAEDYIKGKSRRLPKELAHFKEEFQFFRKQYKKAINGMVVEDTWAFTKDWDRTTWDDWTHCWIRIKLDCAHTEEDDLLIVTDWKTGKFRPDMNEDYIEQLELYALAALLLHEHINRVMPRLAYLDEDYIYPEEESREQEDLIFTRKDIPKLKKLWEKRVRPMMNDKSFAPKPNDKCHWCFYRCSNKNSGGGQCKF